MDETEHMICRLQHKRDEIEGILKRRDAYIEMIDWSAMTHEQRERTLKSDTEYLHMELWAIDAQLDGIICWSWPDG